VAPELIDRVLAAAERFGAAVPGLPVTDTLKEVGADRFVTRTLDRARVMVIQTPQMFRRELLERAFRHAGDLAGRHTDCAGLVESAGARVAVVPGDAANVKITTPLDLAVVAQLLARRSRPRQTARRV
jgi:2-C-methyl-D-erythritol 4-phosphate cytidylyltransferase